MRERNSKEPRLQTELGSSSKSKFKKASNQRKGNPLDNLKCSPAMKKFILSEFKREKVSHNFLPEQQVAMAVIHRYKTYIASSGGNTKGVNLSSKKNKKINQFAKIGGNKTKFKKNSKKGSSVGDSGFLDDLGNEEVEIQEFDENDLPIPSMGSFSLNPSPAQSKSKRLLVRYNSDNDTDNISDSSPVKSVAWDIHDEGSLDVVNKVCGGEVCGWCLEYPGPSILQLCSACSSVAYCGPQCQGKSWPTHKKICKKLKGANWTVKLELVREMTKKTKINSLKRKSVSTESGPKNNKKKLKRTVQFNSQPQFEPSQDKVEEEKYANKMVTDYPKSILRKSPVKLQTVLHSPPVKSLQQHLAILRAGTQEERFKIVTGQAVESGTSGNSLKRQASEKLRRKLKDFKNVKLNLDEKLDDEPEVADNTDQPKSGPSSHVASPSRLLFSSTPVSSPTLVDEIKTLSSSRQRSCRVLSKRFDVKVTPYPHVNLESDQELDLTPVKNEDEDELSSIAVFSSIPRRLDFDVEDLGDDDENIIRSSKLLQECCKITNEDDISLPVASQDIFESPDSEAEVSNKILDESIASNCELVPVGHNSESKIEDSGSCPEDENCRKLADGADSNMMIAKSSNQKKAKNILVMVPESSSESSSEEFSPLSQEIFSQSQVECTDQLTDLFSDNDCDQVIDDNNQEDDDLLAII